MIIRIAEPIELWDGTQPLEKSVEEFANERDWSVFDLRGDNAPTPELVLAAFYGNRKGPKPRHHPRYVIFQEAQLLATGGRLEVAPAFFDWPPEVSSRHVDLFDHQQNPEALFSTFDRDRQLVEVARAPLHIGMATLAVRADAPHEFRTKVVDRLRKLQRSEPTLFDEIRGSAEEQLQTLLGVDQPE